MLASFLIPSAFRRPGGLDRHSRPGFLNRHLTGLLQSLSRTAYSHPIHTVVFVALLASTTYLTLLDESLIRTFAQRSLVGKPDFDFLAASSKTLLASPDSNWQWTTAGNDDSPSTSIITLVFPNTGRSPLPNNDAFSVDNSSALVISTSSESSLTTHGSVVTVAVPFTEAPQYLGLIQQLPPAYSDGKTVSDKWIMENARSGMGFSGNIIQTAESVWYSFLNLLLEAETIDIFIMALGYIAMYATFISLFLSMRQMGSKFWLAGSVIFSSVFAFFFGVVVTTRLGVPVNLVLLSEGLPFLVVTIGFEKPISLTKAVLSASLQNRRSDSTSCPSPASETCSQIGSNGGPRSGKDHVSSSKASQQDAPSKSLTPLPMTIPNAIHAAVKECGFQIVCDYALEIGLLITGALSGVQGGLRQFCILAAWVLAFDCILLFTFYTSILFIKLEINRIKRQIAYRRALEDDGLAKSVAASVAAYDDKLYETLEGSRSNSNRSSTARSVFGKHIRDITVTKFKALMVGGFILVNVLNLATIPFISGSGRGLANSFFHARDNATLAILSGQFDPISLAGSGLDLILSQAKSNYEMSGYPENTVVAVMPPIVYQSLPIGSSLGIPPSSQAAMPLPGSQVVGSILKSLEDPILSKWIVIALALSLAFNGYLFNAARWSLKDIPEPSNPPKANEMLEGPPSVADEVPGMGAVAGARTGTSTPLPSLPSFRNLSQTVPSSAAIERAPRLAENVLGTIPTTAAHRPREECAELIKGRPLSAGTAELAPSSLNIPRRSDEECMQLIEARRAPEVADEDLIALSLKGKVPGYNLEKILGDKTRAVKIRRAVVSRTAAVSKTFGSKLLENSKLPYENYNYDLVYGACCENVIGYMPLPVGVAGPLLVDGQNYFLPMATTEGVLVASTSRGCKALNLGGGVVTILTDEGMTRGPCVAFSTLARAGEAKLWLDSPEGQKAMHDAFNSTSRFARLRSLKTAMAGTYLYIRFKTLTGDAMGMNMISKGVEHALSVMTNENGFEDMEIISVSGNYCTDKKSAAVNWINGRGKSVVAEAIVPASAVRDVLKSNVDALVELNTAKNLIGSAMAGSLGGFNAHAANIVTAMYLATGQDPAQNVESSSCITVMRKHKGDLQISVSMPCIEVGTIGGGTILEPQKAMLDLLGVQGAHPTNPGDNARRLARVIAAGVLAGELSLCAALAAGHLVKAHMSHNRSSVNTSAPTGVTTPNTPSTGAGLTIESVVKRR